MNYLLVLLKKSEEEYSSILTKTAAKIKLCRNNKIVKVRKLQSEDIVLDSQRVLQIIKVKLPIRIKSLNTKKGFQIPNLLELRVRLDNLYPAEPWDTVKSQDILQSFFVKEMFPEFVGVHAKTYFGQTIYFSGSLITESCENKQTVKDFLQTTIPTLKIVNLC